MAFEFKLPDIGEGVTEGEVVEWLVAAGQNVDEDQPMVEVMTDKATVTIGAPRAGTIADIRFGVGEVAQVGQVLVVIDTGSGAAAAPAASHAEPEESGDGPAATAVGDIKEGLPGSNFFANQAAARKATPPPAPNAPSATPEYWNDKPLATPATRKLARDLGVDLRSVAPTGTHGRVTKDDVRAANAGEAEARTQTIPAPSMHPTNMPPAIPAAPRAPTAIAAPSAASGQLEERVPFVGIRRKIAERMQTTKNTAAHFTFVEECDVGRLKQLRKRLKPAAKEQGANLTFLPFIVKAVIAALKKHPVLNSALDESTNELVTRRYYNIGIAAATPAGLMVPVIENADQLNLLGVAKEIERLGEGAREGKLSAQELSGSTFTITSLGKQGGLFATPILNHPEVGILGVHQIKQKPVVREGEIVIGDVMLLSLSFDHRIVDGHVGAAFAYDIIALLEDPDRLFLEG